MLMYICISLSHDFYDMCPFCTLLVVCYLHTQPYAPNLYNINFVVAYTINVVVNNT